MKKIIFMLFLALMLVSSCSQGNNESTQSQAAQINSGVANGNIKEFKITAKNFVFEPSTIEVNQGDTVRLIVTSTDVAHGIGIKEYGINQRIEPGATETIEFTADKPGTFAYYCSVYCGSGHKEMKGTLIVK